MADALLDLFGVGYEVSGVPLVSGVDLSVSPGEVVVVVGPNGAGKSTLLRLASGALRPTAGEARLLGEHIGKMSPDELSRSRASFAQPVPSAVPFTVGVIVSMGRHPHRRSPGNTILKDESAIGEAVHRTQVAELLDRPYSTLSGGEQTRVFIAQALAQDTPLLLLDEPTTALDPGNAEKALAVIAGLAARGRGVLLVLHDLTAAARHAGRVVLMRAGGVVASGPPRMVLRSDLLSDVYGHPMSVVEHPETGELMVTAVRAG